MKKTIFVALIALATNAFAQYNYLYTPYSMTAESQTCQREIKGDIYEKGISKPSELSQKTKFYCKGMQQGQVENLISLYKEEVKDLAKNNPEEYAKIKQGVAVERKCMSDFDKARDSDSFTNLSSQTQQECGKYKNDFEMKQVLKKFKF